MYSRKWQKVVSKIVVFLSVFSGIVPVFAQEPPITNGATEKFSGAQDQNWEKVFNDLTNLKIKLDTQAATVKSLIAEKTGLKGELLSKKMDEIKREHRKYAELVAEYNLKNDEFLTRYPERGLKEKRLYKRAKLKTIESFEDDQTFRGKLNKLHKKIVSQYPKSPGAKPTESETSENEKKEPTKDVTESIKVKK